MPAPPQRSHQVLIVDDNQDITFVLSLVVEELGHQTHVAHSAADALACAAETKPDTVILDIGLPDRDGYEVARELRASTPGITLVALTGWSRDQDIQKARDAGFDHHLTKPVGPDDIRALFAGVLR